MDMRFPVFFFLLALPLAAGVPVKHQNLSDTIALSGYDAVSYFSGEPVEGKSSIEFEHAGARYLFASEANRVAFQSDPERYIPAYGGWCAYAMLDGDKVEVDPESFKIIDGKNYLFYNGFWGDTLKRWNKKLAKTPESELVGEADQEWEGILAKK